jgi:methionyl-tRNA formyltransferase
MRIVFMGTAELSCSSLEALARDKQFSVVAVITQPDRPKGRELKPQPSPVKALAPRLGLPVLQPERARDEKFIGELRGLAPDLVVVVAYGQILPPAILDLPKHGCLNVHTSLLPKYRGAAPIQWALANGDTGTGVTIMKMDVGLDTGAIVAQRRTPIQATDDSATLHDRLAQLGAELLVQTIPEYVAGKIQPSPQPAEGVSHAPKIKKEDGRIDWNLPAKTIWNRLRAFTPWPGAFTFLPEQSSVGRASPRAEAKISERLAGSLAPPQLLKIWKAEAVEEFVARDVPPARLPGSGTAAGRLGEATLPGEILSADNSGVIVSCGQNALRILELQREGGRRMSAAEFLAGHPLKPGAKFE